MLRGREVTGSANSFPLPPWLILWWDEVLQTLEQHRVVGGGAGGQGREKNELLSLQKHSKALLRHVGGWKSPPVRGRMSSAAVHYYSAAFSLLPLL